MIGYVIDFFHNYGMQILGFFAYQVLEFWFGRTDKTPVGSFGEFILWKMRLVKPVDPTAIKVPDVTS